jgi:hypothetical protein
MGFGGNTKTLNPALESKESEPDSEFRLNSSGSGPYVSFE